MDSCFYDYCISSERDYVLHNFPQALISVCPTVFVYINK
nr:MAG TPA: hypothetical protein [Caudoviricetes sp.]